MPFPAHLYGLNLDPASAAYDTPSVSQDELAQTLALWTNVDFSFDDGGIGLNSAQKLLDDDAAAALARQQQQQSQSPQDRASSSSATSSSSAPVYDSSSFFPHSAASSDLPVGSDPLDPFGLTTTLFALHQAQSQSHPSAAYSAFGHADERPSHKRKTVRTESGSSGSGPVKGEDSGASPAEAISHDDDKRRRNTAASARFRQKKKEREQALERTSKELESRCALLEREVENLRKENSWLKGLVVAGSEAGAVIGPGGA